MFLSYDGSIDNKREYRDLDYALSRSQMFRLCKHTACMRNFYESILRGFRK